MSPLTLPVVVVELDVATAPNTLVQLRDAIAAAGHYDVELDFSAVRFMDSTGIGALVQLKSFIEAHGGELALVHVQRRPCRALTTAGLISTSPRMTSASSNRQARASSPPSPSYLAASPWARRWLNFGPR